MLKNSIKIFKKRKKRKSLFLFCFLGNFFVCYFSLQKYHSLQVRNLLLCAILPSPIMGCQASVPSMSALCRDIQEALRVPWFHIDQSTQQTDEQQLYHLIKICQKLLSSPPLILRWFLSWPVTQVLSLSYPQFLAFYFILLLANRCWMLYLSWLEFSLKT